jgi:hypothetical protein
MPCTAHSLVTFGAAALTVVPAFAHTGAESPVPHLVLAYADMLPIAVVLGAGVLTWLLGNRRPRLQPARPRKPEDTKGRRTRDR